MMIKKFITYAFYPWYIGTPSDSLNNKEKWFSRIVYSCAIFAVILSFEQCSILKRILGIQIFYSVMSSQADLKIKDHINNFKLWSNRLIGFVISAFLVLGLYCFDWIQWIVSGGVSRWYELFISLILVIALTANWFLITQTRNVTTSQDDAK